MTPIYSIGENPPCDWPTQLRITKPIEKNWWSLDVISRPAFEDTEHILEAIDDDYNELLSDDCADISKVDSAVWAFSETSWDWLPRLKDSGCRIANNVRVSRGSKRYKLVYCAPVLDLLDHENADFSWNDGVTSWVRGAHFYEWDGEPPLMFQVLFHHQRMYRGVTESPSMICFVSHAFSEELGRRELTGVNLSEIPRTKRPASETPAPSVLVYEP